MVQFELADVGHKFQFCGSCYMYIKILRLTFCQNDLNDTEDIKQLFNVEAL